MGNMTNTATGTRTYTATTPAGAVVTRTSRSPRLHYTHIRVIDADWSRGEIVTWHTSEDLAANGRSDNDPQHLETWTVAPATQTAGPDAQSVAPALELAPIGHDAARAAGAKLGTIGRGKAVHLVFGWDGERRTNCRASVADRRAYGPTYDRDAVVTCRGCTTAHNG